MKHIRGKIKIQKTSKNIFPFGSETPLPLLGKFSTVIESRHKFQRVMFYIAKHTSACMGSLLGFRSAIELGLVNIVKGVSVRKPVECDREVVVGKMKGVLVALSVDESVKPVALQHRRIPFHFREGKERSRPTVEADVIESIDETAGWVSPAVIVNKPDGNIRLYVNMTETNKSINRIHDAIPTIEDIRYQLNGANIFQS